LSRPTRPPLVGAQLASLSPSHRHVGTTYHPPPHSFPLLLQCKLRLACCHGRPDLSTLPSRLTSAQLKCSVTPSSNRAIIGPFYHLQKMTTINATIRASRPYKNHLRASCAGTTTISPSRHPFTAPTHQSPMSPPLPKASAAAPISLLQPSLAFISSLSALKYHNESRYRFLASIHARGVVFGALPELQHCPCAFRHGNLPFSRPR
jgi:hypothetical protein